MQPGPSVETVLRTVGMEPLPPGLARAAAGGGDAPRALPRAWHATARRRRRRWTGGLGVRASRSRRARDRRRCRRGRRGESAGGVAFDVVYLSPGACAHVVGCRRRVETLRRLSRHVRPGGRLAVFAEITTPEPPWARARLVDVLRRIGRRFAARVSEPGDRYERGFATVPPPGSWRAVHRFRRASEVVAELSKAGLEIEAAIDDRLWVSRPIGRRPAPGAG